MVVSSSKMLVRRKWAISGQISLLGKVDVSKHMCSHGVATQQKFDYYIVRSSALCSRNFQNVKLRLDFLEIWQIYLHSDFTWNPILVNWNGPKMSFLNFDFGKFEQLSSPKFTKILSSESLELAKMTFLDCLNSPKLDFT